MRILSLWTGQAPISNVNLEIEDKKPQEFEKIHVSDFSNHTPVFTHNYT